ncbi:putative reverse transcriptase domain-containing protein [Tanacetum coccineum]
MAPTTRRGPNTPVNNTNPNNMTLESIQAMIDQALLRNSTNGDGSHSSHGDNRRNVQTARPCFYADFMKKSSLQTQVRWRDIELANDLMDQKLLTYAERQSDNKRKTDDSSRNNHGHQQQPFKRLNVAKKGNGAAHKGNGCFKCGAPGHFKRDCHKLKNKDGRNVNAQGWVYAVGNAEKRGNAPGNPDANIVTTTDYPLRSSNGRESRLTVISCSKAQEYMAKGCQVFLAQISAKKEEDKSSSGSTSGIPNRLDPRSRTRSSSTVLIGSIQNEGIIGTITRAFRQRIHKA